MAMSGMTQREKLILLKRKAEKPLAYDITREEYDELGRQERANPKVFYDFIELRSPFETPLHLQAVTSMKEVPAVYQVETRPVFPEEVPPRVMNVCRLEYLVWKPVEECLLREGYKVHETTISFQGENRIATSYKKTNVSCKLAR